jgi:hypothetical protein
MRIISLYQTNETSLDLTKRVCPIEQIFGIKDGLHLLPSEHIYV